MSYDGEANEDDWCSNHACYVWQCPKPTPLTAPGTSADTEAGR